MYNKDGNSRASNLHFFHSPPTFPGGKPSPLLPAAERVFFVMPYR